MSDKLQSTEPYKGVRDFYPRDMAVQQYICDSWRRTAESFGYEEYTASVLEPAELYRAKASASEEIVNDQTYTFTDRGDREVTLRPEMTPTVARMIAGKQKELSFPVRWYSIPNVFRYERPQKGRLREHWQLNCDMFGSDTVAAEIEMITLAYRMFTDFGATQDMFEIRLNDRGWLNERFTAEGFTHEQSNQMLYLLDRSAKIENFAEEAEKIAGKPFDLGLTEPPADSRLAQVLEGLAALGITNAKVSLSTVRGFNYYTGTIFELFDISGENNRSLAGGGRYDNLTGLFNEDPVSGIGFGLGDVTMRDFLETHNLLPDDIYRGPTVAILPFEESQHTAALQLADTFRAADVACVVDLSSRKIGKKISAADNANTTYVLTLGENEIAAQTYTLKQLESGEEINGTITDILTAVTNQ